MLLMGSPKVETAARGKVRVMLVDDHPVFRLGLRELINQEEDLAVCAEAEDVASAWREIQSLEPDMVIVDISLKGRDGICLVKEIAKYYRNMPVLVLSMHDESRFAERSLLAGAKGYIMKQETISSIIEAMRCVLEGKIYLSEKLKDVVLTQFASGVRTTEKSPVDNLSDRELEVYRMIGHGFGTNEIAQKLHLSVKTIGCYRERIKEKLGLKSGTELMRNAMRWVEDDSLLMEPGS
jgi:DNA-binding NarL/FixJ family response regulator